MKRYRLALAMLLILPGLLIQDSQLLRASNEIKFQFRFPGAKKVKVYGSFNSWSKGYLLKNTGSDSWEQNVELNRGRYEYKFLVDGKWRYDASLPTIDDGLYSRNNVIIVR